MADPFVPQGFVAVDAAGVNAEEDVDAVPGAAGDFGGGHASVQRHGHPAVPEVVVPGAGRGGPGQGGPGRARHHLLFDSAI
jgi:hypothetical protein